MIGQMTLIFYSTLVWFYRSNLRCATLGRKFINLGVVSPCLILTFVYCKNRQLHFLYFVGLHKYYIVLNLISIRSDQTQCIYTIYIIFTSKVWWSKWNIYTCLSSTRTTISLNYCFLALFLCKTIRVAASGSYWCILNTKNPFKS